MIGEDIILSQSEYEALLEEIHRLQARISELTALRDDLIYHICPALQAEYEEKISAAKSPEEAQALENEAMGKLSTVPRSTTPV